MKLKTGSKAVVIGLGKSGLATIRFLHQQGVRVSVSESRPLEKITAAELSFLEQFETELETGGHSDTFLEAGCLVVPSPGVPLDLPVLETARKRNCFIAGELALAANFFDAPVIAITGTNGKTTVTSLLGKLLEEDGYRVFVGGNIGNPVLDQLATGRKVDVYVLEVSSFQLDLGGEFRPDIALLLNLSPDHLDRHGSMEQYAAAKRLIFANQGFLDTAIIGCDDPLVTRHQVETAAKTLCFGTKEHHAACATQDSVVIAPRGNRKASLERYNLKDTRLSSRVNRLNCAAAILAAQVFGTSSEAINRGLQSYCPPAHRMHPVAEINRVRWIDDSKATNIGSVVAALESCREPVILIAGGRNKGNDFRLLRQAVSDHVKQLILIGESSEELANELDSLVPTHKMGNMHDAVTKAASLAEPGDVVLLAPGCASFDMFSSYAERGRVFQQEVKSLLKKPLAVQEV